MFRRHYDVSVMTAIAYEIGPVKCVWKKKKRKLTISLLQQQTTKKISSKYDVSYNTLFSRHLDDVFVTFDVTFLPGSLSEKKSGTIFNRQESFLLKCKTAFYNVHIWLNLCFDFIMTSVCWLRLLYKILKQN